MSFHKSINHIEECQKIISFLKAENLNDFADQLDCSIRYSSTGLEIVFTMFGILESVKDSGQVQSLETRKLIDFLINDLKKRGALYRFDNIKEINLFINCLHTYYDQ
jgi:hypothetical protein